jgi:hypothetical protein
MTLTHKVVTNKAATRNVHLMLIDLMDVIKDKRWEAKERTFYVGLVYDLMGWAQVSLGIRLMKSK